MAELVGEHAESAVLGLGRVVEDPVAGVADLDAAGQVARVRGRRHAVRARGEVRVEGGTAAVRPDRPRGRAGLLAGTGVDRLEVVDVAVGLVEVAVVVDVVAVPLVEPGEVVLHLLVRHRRRRVVEPRGRAVADEVGHVLAALLAVRLRVVRRRVVDADPVGHVAGQVEPTARHLGVDALERLAVLVVHAVEEHVEVVLAVEARLPVGAVVRRCGLRDLVVDRARGLRGEVRVALAGPEVDQEGQQLRVLGRGIGDLGAVGHQDGARPALAVELGLARHQLLDRRLAHSRLPRRRRRRPVVGAGHPVIGVAARRRGRGGCRLRG